MKKLLLALLFLGALHTVTAQAPSSKDKKIKELLEISGSGKLGVQVANQMLTSFKSQYSLVPEEFWDKMKSKIKADDLIALVAPLYSKHFTEPEIEQLIAFYKTPIGQKTIQVMPLLAQESMQAGQEWGQKLGAQIAQELLDGGYKPNSI